MLVWDEFEFTWTFRVGDLQSWSFISARMISLSFLTGCYLSYLGIRTNPLFGFLELLWDEGLLLFLSWCLIIKSWYIIQNVREVVQHKILRVTQEIRVRHPDFGVISMKKHIIMVTAKVRVRYTWTNEKARRANSKTLHHETFQFLLSFFKKIRH